jgi:hypothetical protein
MGSWSVARTSANCERSASETLQQRCADIVLSLAFLDCLAGPQPTWPRHHALPQKNDEAYAAVAAMNR